MRKCLSRQIMLRVILVFSIMIGNIFVKADEVSQSKKEGQTEKEKSQKKEKKRKKETQKTFVLHNEIVVTATRTEKTIFNVPKPVSVVNQKKIEEQAPNNISELLAELPGTDIVGVGPNQSRPIIRGLRGQRILLLADGIRLSNSRRTQDFGEIPALVDVSGIERIEVIRGPASVLYGSEAIGGVVNMMTRTPDYNRSGANISGYLGYRYSSADTQHKAFANIYGNINNFGFMLSGTYRKAEEYLAPDGSFGKITLTENTPVKDSGVRDNSFNMFLGFRLSEKNNISLKYEYYNARDAGFGYVDPDVYSPADPTIQLLYPNQKMQKFTLKYENRGLKFLLADGISLTSYYMNNTRTFDTNIAITFFPGAGTNIQSSNFTDVDTMGFRFELTKVVFNKHILTYGIDLFKDDSDNTDINTTEMFFFGPPQRSTDSTPKVPNASLRSLGLFIQDEIFLFPKSTLILGLRYQNVQGGTKETQGWEEPLVDSTDSTLVGAANFIYGVTDNFKLLLSLGRGFRSPNIPERFFQGVVPDGRGFQVYNPDLKPETSFNIDVGVRYRLENLYFESTYFRNTVYDGIQVAPTGKMFGGLPEYRNVNVDKLQLQGVELLGQINLSFGLSFLADFSYVASKDLSNPKLPYSDTYSSRFNFNIRYVFPQDLFWVEYHIRHHGDQKDVDLGSNPIGPIIPGFTVNFFRAGITLFKQSGFPQQLGVIIGNLTNILYSEFSNASFFRPAPKRHVILTWSTRF